MSLPTPVIAPVADIPAASLPTSVVLNGSGSLPSSGATAVVGWEWVLHDKPPGSAAFLNNPTTVNPTLENIDTVGSYLVSLKVTDDLGVESFSGIEPVQATTAPYGFTFPTSGSMLSVRVVTPNAGLTKVAYGERAWLGRGLWELVDEIDDIRGDLDGLLGSGFSGDIYTDNVYELTSANDIHVHHPIRVNTIKPRTGSIVTVAGRLDVDSLINTTTQVNAQTRVVTPAVQSPAGLDLHALTGPAILEGNAGVTVTATTGAVDIQGDSVLINGNAYAVTVQGSSITLSPTIETTTDKPFFAPGVPLSKTVFFNFPPSAPSGAELVLASQTVTRTSFGGLLRLHASIKYSLLDANARRSDIAWRITPDGDPPQTIALTDTKASPTLQGVMQSTVELPLIGAAILAQRLRWRTGTLTIDGAATAEDSFTAMVDNIAGKDVLIELVLTPQATKTWGPDCYINGLMEVSLSVPTTEAVL